MILGEAIKTNDIDRSITRSAIENYQFICVIDNGFQHSLKILFHIKHH